MGTGAERTHVEDSRSHGGTETGGVWEERGRQSDH